MILESVILAHGSLDLLFFRRLEDVVLYVLIIYLYNFFLIINPSIGLLTFILFGSQHFGDFLKSESHARKIMKGALIISSTYFTTNGPKIWGKYLVELDFPREKIIHVNFLLTNINTITGIGCLFIYGKKSFFPFFFMMATVMITDLENFIILYFMIVHIPVSIYRSSKKFGKKCYITIPSVPICYLFLNSIPWNINLLRLMISISFSHILLHAGILKNI